jgi:light-regulated signal transduction histidine kinase (bacteriophytochrome)
MLNIENDALTDRNARFMQSMLDASMHGILLLAPVRNDHQEITDFLVISANASILAQIRMEANEATGKLVSEIFPEYRNTGFLQLYLTAFDSLQLQRRQLYYKDNRIEGWFDVGVARHDDMLVVTFVNITETKQQQQAIHQHGAQRSNAYLEEFAYAASHDLQEPLRKIQFYSDKVKMQIRENQLSETIGILGRMDSAVNRMSVLIDDLLAYSQLSSEEVQFREVNLNAVLKEVVAGLETSMKEKSAVCSINALPVITGHKKQLQQLFQNLLTNALKYSRAGVNPVITVTARVVKGKEAGELLPPGNDRRSFHLIEVMDNGLGFEPQYAGKIFHIFQRLHGKSEYPGSGVGLAIVQKVVENHNGFVCAEGRPGEGASFKVFLPAEGALL